MFVFTPVLRDVAYTLCLLLRSVGLNRRRPRPICQQPLIGAKSLHGPLSLQVKSEHCLELSSHNILMHLDCCPPKCSMPKEASGKRLD